MNSAAIAATHSASTTRAASSPPPTAATCALYAVRRRLHRHLFRRPGAAVADWCCSCCAPPPPMFWLHCATLPLPSERPAVAHVRVALLHFLLVILPSTLVSTMSKKICRRASNLRSTPEPLATSSQPSLAPVRTPRPRSPSVPPAADVLFPSHSSGSMLYPPSPSSVPAEELH